MNKIDTVMKTNIRKKTEYTVFLEIITISAENTVMAEKNKKIKNELAFI